MNIITWLELIEKKVKCQVIEPISFVSISR